MSCIVTQHDGDVQIALLFEFRGHQGSDKVPPETMERAKRLADDAKKLIKKAKNKETKKREGGQS